MDTRNVSFYDYDLDETDLFGDLLWEAPLDVDSVLLGTGLTGGLMEVTREFNIISKITDFG